MQRISTNLYVVKRDGKVGAVNADNEIVIPIESQYYYFGNGIIGMYDDFRTRITLYDVEGRRI